MYNIIPSIGYKEHKVNLKHELCARVIKVHCMLLLGLANFAELWIGHFRLEEIFFSCEE